MELLFVVLLALNIAVLSVITGILYFFVLYIKRSVEEIKPVDNVIVKRSVKESTQEETEEDPEEDDTVPLEQFTPDFTKPLKYTTVAGSDGNVTIDITEIDKN